MATSQTCGIGLINMSTASTTDVRKVDFDAVISRRLESFANRRRRLLLGRAALAAVGVFGIAMLVVGFCDYQWFLSEPMRWTLSLVGYASAALAGWWYGLREMSVNDPRTLARQIESVDPRFREDLLSAVELAEPGQVNGSPVFLDRLKGTVARQVATIDPRRMLPVALLKRWMMAVGILVAGLVLLTMIPSLQFGKRMARAMLPGVPIQRVSRSEIRIISPSPATRSVAQGDAVGVVVSVGGEPVDEVVLQWLTDEGGSGEAIMTRRQTHEFSANLPVGASPVDYRIRGGDGITLWERLTPQPRPRAESFELRYHYPEYALLDDAVVTTDHGDIKALAGTVVEMAVTFDQPVDNAVLRFEGGRYEINLEALDDLHLRHQVKLPVRLPASYNVDSVSRASGLSNPFSPRYSITPITDTPPVARWGDGVLQSQLVSPLDVLELSATVVDDLPLDNVRQLFQINSGEWVSRRIEVDQPATELSLDWKWELTDLEEFVSLPRRQVDSEMVKALSPGDVIRTRIVAQDRHDRSGESRVVELLVADEGFAKDRHDPLRRFAVLVRDLSKWVSDCAPFAKLAMENEANPPAGFFKSLTTSVDSLLEPLATLRTELNQLSAKETVTSDAAMIHQLGRAFIELERRLKVLQLASQGMQQSRSSDGDSALPSADGSEEDTIVEWNEFVRDSRELESLLRQSELFAKAIVSHKMMLAVANDANSLHASVDPLMDPDREIADQRWPRYLRIAIQRIQEIGRLVEEQRPVMMESTHQQLNRWVEWSENWDSRLQLLVDDFPGIENSRSQLASFQNELRDRTTYGIFDGQAANTLRDLPIKFAESTTPSYSRLVDELKRYGHEASRSHKDAERETDSEKARQSRRNTQEFNIWYAASANGLESRLDRAVSLQQSLPLADLQFVSDLTLMRRAIANVTSEGFQDYKEIPATQVHSEIAQASGRLEALHELVETQRQLLSLLQSQSDVESEASSRFGDPTAFERIQSSIQISERLMQQSDLEWKLIQPFATLRYNEIAQRAAGQLSERRYSKDPLVPVILPLQRLHQELSTALDNLHPIAEEARQTLSKYVLSLPEQARQAAKRAEVASQQIAQRSDSAPATEESLRTPQESAEAAARETIRSLVDLANTRDLMDASDRDLARDADVASAKLNELSRNTTDAMQFSKAAMSDAERAKALDQAAQSLAEMKQELNQTADHFERALAGQDVSESRERMRESEIELGLDEQLEKRYADAARISQQTQSDASAMLEQLERELQRNEPMQKELDEISDESAEAAQRILSRAVNEERAMRQSLERADAVFDERKQQLRNELRGAAKRVGDLERSVMNAAERAVGWNKPREETDEIRSTRQMLAEAAQKAERLDAATPLAELQQASRDLADAVTKAKQRNEKLSERSRAKADEPVHETQRSREDARRQLEQIDRSTRDQRIQHMQSQINAWKQAKNDIGRRIQDAQRQSRDAKNRAKQHQDRLKKEPDNESLKQEVKTEQAREAMAELAANQGQETKEAADRKQKALEERMSELQKSRLADLDDFPNPAAELAAITAEQAAGELADIEQELGQLVDQSKFDDALLSRPDESKQLSQRQAMLNDEVELAAEMLARAARHQERLGNAEDANSLDRAASKVGLIAQGSLRQAAQSLDAAATEASKSAAASSAMLTANRDLAEQAQAIASLIAQQQATSPASETMSDDTSGSAEKLARTLDELDQAVNGSPKFDRPGDSPAAPGDPSQSGQASQSGQSQTAGEASPTLAGAAQSQAQRAARQRSAQTSPQQVGDGDGEPSEESGESGAPGARSGDGSMPGGGLIDSRGVVREGGDWGALRERRTDNAVEDRSAPIAPGYRREIEAYFRAISERAAKQ